MESALAVANYFIQKSWAAETVMTNMKLVKLVYIAHGWHLGLTGQPLLIEKPEAWKYGPVIPSIYNTFKSCGASSINTLASTVNDSGMSVVYSLNDNSLLPFLDKIWELYGKYDGVQLSAMTHNGDTPWSKTWNSSGWLNRSTIIPDDEIKEHYMALSLKKQQVPTS